MLWRQKNRPGRTTGTWVGPVRMLLQEGQTLGDRLYVDPSPHQSGAILHETRNPDVNHGRDCSAFYSNDR